MTERLTDSEVLGKYSEAVTCLFNPLVPSLGKIAAGCEHQKLIEEILARNLLSEAIEIYAEGHQTPLEPVDAENMME